MERTSVIGIGMINRLGNTADEVWDNLIKGNVQQWPKGKTEYPSVLSSRAQRRMNRYSDMSVNAVSRALEDAGIDVKKDIDPYRIGTIFSTGYGAMESNLIFSDSVLDGDPDLCSPTVFANTVSNACIGHICINFGCKGVSTVVMGSNSVGYSQMLISKGDADYVLTGAVEEYNEDLFTCFEKNPWAAGSDLAEATVGLLLSKDSTDSYCDLIDFVECDLGAYPLINKVEDKNVAIVERVLKDFVEKQKTPIDGVICANNGTYFDEVENTVLKNIFGEDMLYANQLKKYSGENLGSSISMSIAIGAMCLKHKMIPKGITEKGIEGRDIHTILITGYDVTGNYVAYLMSGSENKGN
ncbi:MAG: beta-ketoacyl synthase N-terminal-like domain-containing protein [Anaerovoracaceae bacterium]